MYISKIAYILCKNLNLLRDALDELDLIYTNKIENDRNDEVWVEYSDMLVENLSKLGFLSVDAKLEISQTDKLIGITEILFYN